MTLSKVWVPKSVSHHSSLAVAVDCEDHLVLVDYHFKAVKQELKKIPSIEIIRVDTSHDDDKIHALIKVKNKGYLQFIELTKSSFYDSPHLRVNRVGDLQIISPCYPDGIGMSRVWLDIGMQGKEATLFPSKMHNMQDVINHYDDNGPKVTITHMRYAYRTRRKKTG